MLDEHRFFSVVSTLVNILNIPGTYNFKIEIFHLRIYELIFMLEFFAGEHLLGSGRECI